MSTELKPAEISAATVALLRKVMCEHPDESFALDPATGKVDHFQKFVPGKVPRQVVRDRGPVRTAARAPRRRSVRSGRAKARAPDDPSPEPDPLDQAPALRVISRAAFRLELEEAGL